ncbi:hypothetical protein P7F88_25235 [Vibrio hannami]|uniref:hypothetical protein n=1 Tax=Vibrio hannami TaxID=2717094 RepID=UPI00240F5DFB|nr:hypothetical protein [Vibrio hannami]MDG3089169.1 hypothetical protein [Vibrio hannami]
MTNLKEQVKALSDELESLKGTLKQTDAAMIEARDKNRELENELETASQANNELAKTLLALTC